MKQKPPKRPDLEWKVRQKLAEDDDFKENDAFLVSELWIEDFGDRFDTTSDSVSFAVSSETFKPDSVVRKRREFVNHSDESSSEGTGEKLCFRVLTHVMTDRRLADDYVQLVLSIWKEEMLDNYGVSTLRDLSDEQRKDLTPPESITGAFRKLKRQGLVRESGEVERERIRQEERYQEYYG